MHGAGAGLALDGEPGIALEKAAGEALAAAGASRAEAALVFASHPRLDARPLAELAARRLGTAAVLGASAHGVVAGAREEAEPAVAVLALAAGAAVAVALPEIAGAEDAAGAEIEAALGRSATAHDLVVVAVDPVALDVPRLLAALDETLHPALVVGIGAAPGASGHGVAWAGREVARAGACALVLALDRPPRALLTQGCRPITPPLAVTRVEGRWVLELDGRPALDVYREVAREPLAADLRRASEHLLVALPVRRAEPGRDAYAVRPLAGVAPERSAFALADALRPGATLRFALRDADLAREDLKRALGQLSGAPPRAGIYLSCAARGQALFRHAGLETAYVSGALAPAPLAGAFGAFQFGPVAGSTELLTHAGVLALIP